jgi:hypothetical protein
MVTGSKKLNRYAKIFDQLFSQLFSKGGKSMWSLYIKAWQKGQRRRDKKGLSADRVRLGK